MITLYGYSFEVYQVFLLVYIVGYGITFGIMNTLKRIISLFTGNYYNQSDLGMLLDGLWHGCIFVLLGSYL